MALSAAERRLRASLASHESWARTPDRQARTQAAREGRWLKYLEKATALAPANATSQEIARRAESLRQADMKRMSLAAARARRKAS